MIDNKLRWLARLSLIAVIVAGFVIVLGAYTRLTDAGLGCPDWPGCYGHMIVPASTQATPVAQYKAWTEMAHRYSAGILSLLIVMVAFLCVRSALRYGGSYILLSILIIGLLIYQAILGMWTVTLKLMPITVAQHLLGGMLIISLLWLIYLKSQAQLVGGVEPNQYRFSKKWALIGFFLVLTQIALGAWTSTNYAALSCPNFPFCHASWYHHFDFRSAFSLIQPVGINYEGGVLTMLARETIQMTHRLGALVVTLYLPVMAIYLLAKEKRNQKLRRSIYFMLFFLIVQLGLGIINVLYKLPMLAALLHNFLAALLLCSLVALNFYIFRSARYYKARVSYG